MSLLPGLTFSAPGVPIYGVGGGGGGGTNIIASTITLSGSTDPLEITLPTNPNEGFSVRQGGLNNPIAILSIDAGSTGQAEFGIRSISTITGNPVPRVRFESQLIPSVDGGLFGLTVDKVGAGNASTIATLNFGTIPGTPSAGGLAIETELDASLEIGGNGYQVQANSGAALNPRSIVPTANVYVPPTGATQTVAAFSTVAGSMYELYMPNVRIQNEPAGAPAAGAWSQLIVDTGTGALDTFNMASVSTIDNDLQMSRSYSFLATAGSHNLQCLGSLSNTLSTAFTFPQPLYLRQLGTPAFIKAANVAP